MKPQIKGQEVKVGVFLATGLGILMGAILLLGGSSTFSSTNDYYAYFPEVSGLIPGAKVEVAGMRVGSVYAIRLEAEKRRVRVTVRVERAHASVVRKDTVAEVATQGILGDKFVTLTPGNLSEPELKSGDDLTSAVPKDLKSFLSGGEGLIVSLNNIAAGIERLLKTFEKGNRQELFFDGLANTARNLSAATNRINKELEDIKLKKSVGELHEILAKVNSGRGTLGALVNDAELYDDLRALLGGLNRNRIVRNLIRQSVKAADGQNRTDAPQADKRAP